MRRFKPILIATFAAFAVILVAGYVLFGWMFYRYQSAECRERGKRYSERAGKLERDANDVLKVGTRKDAVIRFFQDNGIAPTFDRNKITGTIFMKGCAPAGCGSDDALLGLRVEVDKEGTVTSKPSVGAIYTNCL